MKLFRYHLLNLRKQLTLLILMIFIPVLAILLFTGYKQHQDALEDIETKANQLIRVFIEEQLNIVNQTRHFLSIIAHVPAVQNLNLAECNQFLKEVHQDNPQYSTNAMCNFIRLNGQQAVQIERLATLAEVKPNADGMSQELARDLIG